MREWEKAELNSGEGKIKGKQENKAKKIRSEEKKILPVRIKEEQIHYQVTGNNTNIMDKIKEKVKGKETTAKTTKQQVWMNMILK